MKVDTHVHFWQYDKNRDAWITDEMKILQEDYLPGKIKGTLERNGIDACVAVQADQSELETHYLIELAKSNSFIRGVVGWIDLRSPQLDKRLQYFSQYKIIKGWRHVVQGEPDDFLLNKNFQDGVRKAREYGYAYDILIYQRQLPAAIEFVKQFPEMKLVVDHCAKPDIAHKNIDQWAANMKTLAQHPNVYCKLSGLLTEARWKEWSPAEFYPYLDVVFDAFGTDRLMFGSDWPVMLLSGMYVQWKSMMEKFMEHFNTEDKEKVFGLNAIRFYGLNDQ